MASEESCVRVGEFGLELGLELSLGFGNPKAKVHEIQEQQARILTAKDFDRVVSSEVSSSSSSSSVTKAIKPGTKRSADFPSSSPNRSQVVGWPPVRSYRINTLVSHGKPPQIQGFMCKSSDGDKIISDQKLLLPKMCYFVKVTMDGIPIGRKVDLLAHCSYKALALSLSNMFRPCLCETAGGLFDPNEEHRVVIPRTMDDFILTYEDKDGDWMLVGDVPWEMFVNTVRRLRIMRSDEAKGNSSGDEGARIRGFVRTKKV